MSEKVLVHDGTLKKSKKKATKPSRPVVSIITPVYNTKPLYFRACIESVLSQTFSDFELLICDDGSQEYIKQIVDSYKDTRIIYVRNTENRGAAFCRNRLLDMARGKYLAVLDSDDTMHPTRLEKQVDFMDKNPEIGCLGTLATINNNELFNLDSLFSHETIEDYLVTAGCAFCNSSVMLRKSVLDEYGIRYDTRFVPAEDYALYCDLVGKTKFATLNEILCDYNSYPENISHRRHKEQSLNATMKRFSLMERYYDIKISDKALLAEFLSNIRCADERRLIKAISNLCEQLKGTGDQSTLIFETYKNRYKIICYKTHNLRVQWHYLWSPLRRYFGLSIWWQIFCFITRGVL